LFVPLSIWVIYACVIRGPYSGKVVGVAFAAGALTHVLLFLGYGLFKSEVIGSAGLLVYAAVIGFTPIILAAPIETPTGKIAGTFAMYYKEPREATPRDLDVAAALTRTAGAIISRH
jgi:hypothetical protein